MNEAKSEKGMRAVKENLLQAKARALAAQDANPEGYESVEMSIDEAGATALMANLTNFYVKPQLAVLREYVSNAIDSHRRAKQSKPVLVTIPDTYSRYADEVIVEDFGVGMSKAEIIAVYSKFGASTKTSSSAEIGKFGLGAKSALAAASRFDIVASKDGITTKAYVQKNAAGVGQFYFTSEQETGAPNGVKITIPVIGRSAYSDDALSWFFVGLRPDEIELSGMPIKHVSVHDPKEFESLTLAGVTVGWVSNRSRFNASNSQLHVNVGGVHYSIDITHLTKLFQAAGHDDAALGVAAIKDYTRLLLLNAPLSSLTLHPAREDFIYDEVTVKNLSSLVSNALVALKQHVQTQLNQQETRAEALAFVFTQRKAALPGGKQLLYRGEPVPTSIPVDGWYNIPTTLSNAKTLSAFRAFSESETLSISTIRRAEIEEYTSRGKRVTAKPVPFEQQQAIRVTGATFADVNHAQRQLMKTYEELRFPERKLTANIFFTEPGVKLDPWSEVLFTEEITFEQLKQQVRDEQARRRAEAKANGVVKSSKDTVQFAVVKREIPSISRGRDEYEVEFLTASAIRDLGKPVIVAHKDLPSAFAFTAPSNSANQNTVSDWHRAIRFARHYWPKAAIVIMPTQAKPSTLAERFPGHELLDKALLSEAKRVEATSGRAHIVNAARLRATAENKYRLSSLMVYAQHLTREQLRRVRHEDTRHWLSVLGHEASADENLSPIDASLIDEYGIYLAASADQRDQLVEGWRAQADRYPLLPLDVRERQLSEPVLDDFVLYINAVDAVR